MVFKIDNWSDSDEFCNAIMGFASSTGPLSGPTVTRNAPHAWPQSTNLYAHSATVLEGLGNPVLNSDGLPDWDGGALIQVEYRPAPWDFSGSTNTNNQIDPSTPINYCTQEIDFSTETFTLENHTFKYVSGPYSGKTTGMPVKFTIPITNLVLTFHQLPYLPMAAARALRGRVNSATFLGAVAGTVLFRGAKTTREWNTDGSVVQRVQLVFDERDALHPWNSLPSPSGLTWNPVSDDGTGGGVYMYPTADLNPLVQF